MMSAREVGSPDPRSWTSVVMGWAIAACLCAGVKGAVVKHQVGGRGPRQLHTEHRLARAGGAFHHFGIADEQRALFTAAVVVEPNNLSFLLDSGQSAYSQITLTNRGLISAKDFKFSFSEWNGHGRGSGIAPDARRDRGGR